MNVHPTRSRKLRLPWWLGIGVAAAVGIAVWQLTGSSSARAAPQTAPVTRGDISVTVGGVGKIVAGGTAPSGAGTSGGSAGTAASQQAATGSTLVGSGQAVFPRVAGHVTSVDVRPGQQVETGQVLARLDTAAATSNLIAARAGLDQAIAQLGLDSTGVTPQSLASAVGAVAAARAAQTAASGTLAQALLVNRDAIAAARLQLNQALATSGGATAAKTAVETARHALGAAEAALADVRHATAQQLVALQHAAEAATRELAGDLARLQQDLVTERSFCGTTSPTIGSATAPECAAAAATVGSDQQAIPKDQTAVQTAQDAVAQGQLTTSQAEHQAVAQVRAVADTLAGARDQLTIAQTTGRQTLASARSGLAQARSKAADSEGQARAQLRVARTGLRNAQGALTALRQGAPGPLLAQDRSKIAAARAQIGAARTTVAQASVRAPAAGTVTWVFVTPGGSADLSTPIAAIADLGRLAVSVDLSEFDAARVQTGMRAVVSVDALGGKPFPGRVEFEALTGVDTGGVVTFPVRVRLLRPTSARPGMNVSVRIVVAERRHALRVPLEAVTREGRGGTVTVVGAHGGQTVRSVRLGLSDNKNVEIRSGLHAGERVLIAGAEGV